VDSIRIRSFVTRQRFLFLGFPFRASLCLFFSV
jgi:hypothetical protein